MADPGRPADLSTPTVYSIPAHRSFADALADGLLRQHGRAPDALAGGRILLPNNRAVRTLTEAFVRISGGGLVLPRLIAIGDPELDDRIGGALDPLDLAEPVPPAIDPLDRQLRLAQILRGPDDSAAEAMRLAADLARALDALAIEEVDPAALKEAALLAPELAAHWSRAFDRFLAVIDRWPRELAALGKIDRAERRNHLLHAIADRWATRPPAGFTIAAGITTAAPAVAALLARIARLADGAVVLPALALADAMPDAEWDALGPDEEGRGIETHPQYHLKRLLDRIGIARGEVMAWRGTGRAASPAVRGRAVTHAMTAADFSDKWSALPPPERRLTGIRCAELADGASEAQAIALALREALETPGQTAALVTPDRILAARVSAHLARWGIEADDSAGQPLSQTAAGTLLLALAEAVARGPRPGRHAWPCSSIRSWAGRDLSAWPGSTRRAISTSRCAARARAPGSPGSTSASPRSSRASSIATAPRAHGSMCARASPWPRSTSKAQPPLPLSPPRCAPPPTHSPAQQHGADPTAAPPPTSSPTSNNPTRRARSCWGRATPPPC